MIQDIAHQVNQAREVWLAKCVTYHGLSHPVGLPDISDEIAKDEWELATVEGHPLVNFMLYRGEPVGVFDMRMRDGYVCKGYLEVPPEYMRMLPKEDAE